jgi:opacity protein-like surface antigen
LPSANGLQTSGIESPRAAQEITRLKLDAAISISTIGSDNIFAAANNRAGDLIVLARPSLSAALSDSRHRTRLALSADIARFQDYPGEDYEDLTASLETRYQPNRGLLMYTGADYAALHEARRSPDAAFGMRPTELSRVTAFGGVLARSETLSVRAAATWTGLDYDDAPAANGEIFNNDDRDRSVLEIGARASRAWGDRAIFVQAALEARDYRASFDDSTFQRSSSGHRIGFGVSGPLLAGATGEAHIGVIAQSYDDPRFGDLAALDASIRADWRFAPGARASLSMQRRLEETTLPSASGAIATSASLRVSRTLSNQLEAAADLAHETRTYRLSERVEQNLETGAELRYLLSRGSYISSRYDLIMRNANEAGGDFIENRLTVSLGARLDPFSRAEPFRRAGAAHFAGLHAGAFLGHSALATHLTGPRGRRGSNTADFGADGGAAGLFTGFDWSIDDRVELGLSLEVEDAAQQWDHRGNRVFGVRVDDAAAATVRLGQRVEGEVLVYVRAGLVSASMRTPYDEQGDDASRSGRQTGYRFGAGADIPLTASLFARAEYAVTAYEDYAVTLNGAEGDAFADATAGFRAGLGYRFDGDRLASTEPAQFSGAYAGGLIGHGALITENTGTRNSFDLDVERAGLGALAGAIAGFGMTLGRRMYLSAEVEGGISGASWNIERDPQGRVYSVQAGADAALSARFGLILNDAVLLYARAGAARTAFKTRYQNADHVLAQTDTRNGLRLGGGVEMAASARTRIRMEYVHTDYQAYPLVLEAAPDTFAHRGASFRTALILSF